MDPGHIRTGEHFGERFEAESSDGLQRVSGGNVAEAVVLHHVKE
jgi:hypothetical protein